MSLFLQPSRVMSKSGRWVQSPTAQGAPQPHSFFGRPSKAAASSPLAAQGASQQPYKQGNGQGPITASWSTSSSAPISAAQQAQQAMQNTTSGSMPTSSSAPFAAPQRQGRLQGFTRLFRPRPQPHRHGSGALLDHPDPIVLSSIAEGDQDTGVVDASLHAYHSTDLDASNAASSANRLWAISSQSLSPRRGASAASGSPEQSGPSQGSYVVPSPWSTPAKHPQSSSASPASVQYPVLSPQNIPLGSVTPPRAQTPSAPVGPFEAAARARAAQARSSSSSPDNVISSSSSFQRSPAQAAYPVPSPGTSNGQQQGSDASPAGSVTRASSRQSRSVRNASGQAEASPARDWSTGIAGMSTTKAARPASSASSRRRRL